MKKRIFLLASSFELIIIIATSVLNAKSMPEIPDIISKNKINYKTALKLHNDGKYLDAYNQFTNIINGNDEALIRDYVIYYGAKSAFYCEMFEEAIDLYSLLMKEHPRSSLYPYAEQYKALAEFYRDDYPVSNFFNGKAQKWIKEFVGLKALQKTNNKNKEIALELINRFYTKDAIIYFNNNFQKEALNLPNNIKYKMATELYEAGFRNSSLNYFNSLIKQNYNKANCLYYTARINQQENKREEAAKLFDIYLANTNNKSYRRLGLYYSADNYYKLKNTKKSISLYQTFLKEYPKDDYVPRIYNIFLNESLNANNLISAKRYLTNSLKKFPNNRWTETSLKSYLRKSLRLKNKTETYYGLKILEERHSKLRNDFILSWNIWIANEFKDFNKRDEYVLETLLTSKNPYYIKGALTLANKDMLQNVYSNNAYNMEEAKKFFADSNYSKTLEFLNKIQFIDYIATKREDKLVKEARDIAKKIFMQNKFVKDFYSKKTENEIFNELSLQTRKESNKSILLYYYGDNQNAYNEFDKIYSKTQTTYPLFYYAQKIFLDSANTKRFMQICNNIGKYFGYPYSQNVDLLPEEFRKYIYPRYFDDLVVPEAKYYKIEPEFIYSIMREESLFDSKALSWAGARGLMQLMPATARAENKKTRYKFNPLNLYDSKQNIYLGISHLSWLFQSENASNYIIVAAKYNAGSSRGNRWKNEYGTNNMYRTGRFIDIEETEYYVEKVMKSYEYYSRYY
ncbi:tetratricopeptide repeat protein [Brachyspira aalborgi]|jgi:soluble lytic murein transglycosylase|uniref:Tetratricopeptide repeat protein n=1 Tax=Brachyspira aalborgi TaxID=29522 RepID=A0AB38Q1X5_9SPIR|nr:lytic transglycosylase domain-containing protein [Brachyspira aalborgi]TXJ16687.1 tetratricopeptide repeat protein [Brachyspira aalborgi]TXJ22097.1 tetratricopeptide repeat protein [Brachyspira aalborgi]TXJ26872.1 tetratricopeptide repeat protein [Brachyspira aalborgi]TXJ50643.1 tetratricopeptide repeat protein [Brachyspira aalborgi]